MDTTPNTQAEIETERLLLRRWRPEDLEPFAALNADPTVMRYFLQPYSREENERFYATIQREFADRGYGLYAAEERATGDFLGFIGFHCADMDVDFCPCVEIGWRLVERCWNRGLATEGAAACLAHGFTRLGLERVYSFTSEQNRPSQRVMQKLGMRLHQHFEHPSVPQDHPLRPHVCYVITRGDAEEGGGKP